MKAKHWDKESEKEMVLKLQGNIIAFFDDSGFEWRNKFSPRMKKAKLCHIFRSIKF